MSIVINKLSRRQFLVGTGGTFLALPLLPSLFSSSAFAQSASAISPRILMLHFGHNTHSGAWPNKNIATTPVGSNGAREVLLSGLASSSAISPVLANAVFENLRKKNQITIARGLDNHFTNNGHGAQALSGCANYRVDQYYPGPFPSIDTVMESSPTLYPAASTPTSTTKAMRINNFEYQLSYKKSGTSGVQGIGGYSSLSDMYNQVFSSLTGGGSTTPPPADPTLALKNNILNRVYSSYSSVKQSRKISSDDKLRLDEHMSLILDVQKKYQVTPPVQQQASCNKPSAVSGGAYTANIPLYFDLLALSFKCGLSKVGVFGFEGHDGSNVPGITPSNLSLHNDIFHNTSGQGTSSNILASYIGWKKWHMDQLANRFLSSLDQEEGTSGRTYLDNMLTVVLSESGMDNGGFGHSNYDYQPVFFGSMAGAMRAGRYIALPDGQRLPYNTLLITLLQLMKIPASEFNSLSSGGKGYGLYGSSSSHPLYSRFFTAISELIA